MFYSWLTRLSGRPVARNILCRPGISLAHQVSGLRSCECPTEVEDPLTGIAKMCTPRFSQQHEESFQSMYVEQQCGYGTPMDAYQRCPVWRSRLGRGPRFFRAWLHEI